MRHYGIPLRDELRLLAMARTANQDYYRRRPRLVRGWAVVWFVVAALLTFGVASW